MSSEVWEVMKRYQFKNLNKKLFENRCKPFVIEPTPVKVALWGEVFVEITFIV